MHSPPLEPSSPNSHEYEATGRGGAGNIVRSRSGSREPRSRSASRGPNGRASSLARMLNKVGIHGRHEEGEGSPSMTAVTEDGESAHTQE